MGGEAVRTTVRLIGTVIGGGAFMINWGNRVGKISDACE